MRPLTALLCTSVFLGSAAAQPPKSAASPCALLTKAEVLQAVGSPVFDGALNATNKSICDFKVGATGSLVLRPRGKFPLPLPDGRGSVQAGSGTEPRA